MHPPATALVTHDPGIPLPDRPGAAQELSQILPPGATLAIGECGFVPYYVPDVRIFDVFGLMTPEIAELPGPHTEKLTVLAFLEEHPGYYLYRSPGGSEEEQQPIALDRPAEPYRVTFTSS